MEEIINQTASQEPVFEVTDASRLHLLSISKWMKFFYYIAVFGVVLVAIMGLAYIFAAPLMLKDDPGSMALGPIVGLVIIAMDVFFGYVTYCLGKSAAWIKVSLPGKESDKLEIGLNYLRKTLKTYGIFCIALLALYALIIVVAIIVAIITLALA